MRWSQLTQGHITRILPEIASLFVVALVTLVAVLSFWRNISAQDSPDRDAAARPTAVATQPSSPLPTPMSATPTPYPPGTIARVEGVRALLSAPQPQISYAGRRVEVDEAGFFGTRVFIEDGGTGATLRLGDDYGNAQLWQTYPSEVLWSYLCNPCPTREGGLYLYSVISGTNTLISSNQWIGDTPQKDGEWIVAPLYREHYSPRSYPSLRLWAHNVATHEELILSEDLFSPIALWNNYAVGSGIAVWVEYKTKHMLMHNFATGVTRFVPLEDDFTSATNLEIHDGVITWIGDHGAEGFDLKTGTRFPIPRVPADWPYNQAITCTPVQIDGNGLTWGLQTEEVPCHYYTADIVRGPAAPQPTPVPSTPAAPQP